MCGMMNSNRAMNCITLKVIRSQHWCALSCNTMAVAAMLHISYDE
jgi:hypothetical protein